MSEWTNAGVPNAGVQNVGVDIRRSGTNVGVDKSHLASSYPIEFPFRKLHQSWNGFRPFKIILCIVLRFFIVLTSLYARGTRDRGSTRSASARRREGVRFESRSDTAS